MRLFELVVEVVLTVLTPIFYIILYRDMLSKRDPRRTHRRAKKLFRII